MSCCGKKFIELSLKEVCASEICNRYYTHMRTVASTFETDDDAPSWYDKYFFYIMSMSYLEIVKKNNKTQKIFEWMTVHDING